MHEGNNKIFFVIDIHVAKCKLHSICLFILSKNIKYIFICKNVQYSHNLSIDFSEVIRNKTWQMTEIMKFYEVNIILWYTVRRWPLAWPTSTASSWGTAPSSPGLATSARRSTSIRSRSRRRRTSRSSSSCRPRYLTCPTPRSCCRKGSSKSITTCL